MKMSFLSTEIVRFWPDLRKHNEKQILVAMLQRLEAQQIA